MLICLPISWHCVVSSGSDLIINGAIIAKKKLRDFSIGICRLDLLARVSRLNELFNNFDNSESAENGIVALIDGRIRPAIVVHKVYVAMISIGSLIT